MARSSEERKLYRLLKRQDRKAINLLYDRYSAALYGVALKVVQDESIAQDVLQEAFVKIWKNADKYNPTKGSLFTWMLNITRNLAIDKIRSAGFRKQEKIRPLDESVYNSTGHSESINPNTIGIHKLVNGLDEKYRKVIDLIYFGGFTQQEVQQKLDIPLGTVKSRLRIALRELRKIFEEQKVD